VSWIGKNVTGKKELVKSSSRFTRHGTVVHHSSSQPSVVIARVSIATIIVVVVALLVLLFFFFSHQSLTIRLMKISDG
jgi:hypothetical protein